LGSSFEIEIIFEKVLMNKDDLDCFKIEDMEISEILDDVKAESLGIKVGYQILRINGESVPKKDLKEYLHSEDVSEFEFELQVFLTEFLKILI